MSLNFSPGNFCTDCLKSKIVFEKNNFIRFTSGPMFSSGGHLDFLINTSNRYFVEDYSKNMQQFSISTGSVVSK